jgi:multimeric flavodoxin WrbA
VRVTTILGSPRKQGNTATVLESFEELLTREGHEVDRVNVVDCEVNGCLGCNACQKVSHAPGCIQSDDAIGIFERLIASDAVVYATPLYTYGFTSQLKALIDRECCLVTGYGSPEVVSLLGGKRTALLVTCGGPIEGNADLIQEAFEREGAFQQWDIVGKYVVPSCGAPEDLGDRAVATAARMFRDVVGG